MFTDGGPADTFTDSSGDYIITGNFLAEFSGPIFDIALLSCPFLSKLTKHTRPTIRIFRQVSQLVFPTLCLSF